MKLTKRVLGLLLALAMVVGCLPALDVNAAENSNYSEVLQPSSGYTPLA